MRHLLMLALLCSFGCKRTIGVDDCGVGLRRDGPLERCVCGRWTPATGYPPDPLEPDEQYASSWSCVTVTHPLCWAARPNASCGQPGFTCDGRDDRCSFSWRCGEDGGWSISERDCIGAHQPSHDRRLVAR